MLISVLLLIVGAGGAGYWVRRWWVAAVPPVLGVTVALFVDAAGASLRDRGTEVLAPQQGR